MKGVMKLALSLAIITGLFLFMSFGMVYADGNHKREKIEMAQKAKVSLEEASVSALKEMPGTIIEAELEDEHGSLMWEIEVVTLDGKIRGVHIDALAGKIVGH